MKTAAASTHEKKRGRKSKSTKLVMKMDDVNNILRTGSHPINNHVILHLKCSLDDLQKFSVEKKRLFVTSDPLIYDPDIPLGPQEVVSYNENSDFVPYVGEHPHAHDTTTTEDAAAAADTTIDVIHLRAKLARLKISYYKGGLGMDKKSDCFWCSCSFDNSPCYIPKMEQHSDHYYGYGSFCTPECAVAYLFKERLDESIKFDRYHLVNKIYGPIYNYQRNIQPAPDPHYLLDKFYGDLSIEEYRKLLETPQKIIFIDKPLTRLFPEMHDEMTCTGVDSHGVGGIYKVKRESEKQKEPSKTDLLKTKFHCKIITK